MSTVHIGPGTKEILSGALNDSPQVRALIIACLEGSGESIKYPAKIVIGDAYIDIDKPPAEVREPQPGVDPKAAEL